MHKFPSCYQYTFVVEVLNTGLSSATLLFSVSTLDFISLQLKTFKSRTETILVNTKCENSVFRNSVFYLCFIISININWRSSVLCV